MNNKFFFILVKPQLGENIGACARSLKNFHFSKLRLVSPKALWPNEKAKATSVGAYDIIRNAKVFKNTGDAVKDCDIVVSLSARKRNISKRHISITQFSKKIKASKNKKIGLLFGPESSGLSNEDLSLSNLILQIPTANNFKSINLSHSLSIICYELFKIYNHKLFDKNIKTFKSSSKTKILSLISHLKNLLDKKGFFTPIEKKKSMMMNINNLFHRLEPTDKELRVLASIISSLGKKDIKRN